MDAERLKRLRALCGDDETFAEVQQLINDEVNAQLSKQLSPSMLFDPHTPTNTRIIILHLDVSGVVQQINQAGARMLGYEPEQLIGLDWFMTCTPAEESATLHEGFQRTMRGEQPVSGYYESPVVSHDGSVRLIAWHNILLTDTETDAIVGVLSTGEDITEIREMETQLHQRSIRYRQMFETNRAVKLLVDAVSTDVVDANQAAVDFYGYERDSLLNLNFYDLSFNEDDRRDLAANVAYVWGGHSSRFIARHQVASGDVRDVEIYLSPLSSMNENLLYVIIFDITKRTRMQQELAHSEAMLRAATNHFPSGSIILFDRNLNYILARGQHITDQGIDPLMLEGQPIESVTPIMPDALSHYRDVLEGVSSRREFTHDDKHYLSQVEPVLDENAQIIAGLHIFQDITDLKRARAALRSKSVQLEAVMEGIYDALTVIAPTGHVLYMNSAARLLLPDVDQLDDIREVYRQLPMYDDQGQVVLPEMLPVSRALNGEHVLSQTLQINWLPDLDSMWVISKARPVFDDEGQLLFVVSIISDITRLKESEKYRIAYASEQARTEALRSFITDAAHDLFTPLSVLGTTIYLLKRSDLDERQQERLSVLDRQTRRLQSLIQDMFVMLKLDTLSQLDHAEIDINRLVREIMTDLDTLNAEREHQIAFEPCTPHQIIYGDEGQLYRAIHSIVANAIIYTPPNGEIEIRCQTDWENFRLTIQDNGIGIPKDELTAIFNRFHRVDKARSNEEFLGSGLGLTIARKIIELHDGQITVDSELGTGTTFTITLPL